MQLNVIAYSLDPYEGYGRYTRYTIRSLVNAGASVYPSLRDTASLPGWLSRMAGLDFSRHTLAVMPGGLVEARPGRQGVLTMYETTRLPKEWVERLNKHSAYVIVPSTYLVEMFKASGVEVPIRVVPGGIDPAEFPALPTTNAERGKPFTFLCLGDRGTRKGFDTVWSAFWRAFGDTPDVRLVIKARATSLGELDIANSDRRLSIWREDVESLADVFAACDCFVFPTKGEGYGMPPREAAAMGIPVICTAWSGVADDIDQWALPIRDFKMADHGPMMDGNGRWAKPSVDATAALMRYVYENRDEARAKAKAASAWLHANQTWQQSGEKLLATLKELN